jgi:PAS domain S-box-containing protein
MAGIAAITREPSLKSTAEEISRLAVDACPNGLLMIDDGGRIALANAKVERLFGYGREQLIGQPVEILLPEWLRNEHLQRHAAFAHRSEARRLGAGRNLLGRRRDGSEFILEIGLHPVDAGDRPFALLVMSDITERERMDRLKDEFVSTVSHELRTPLTSIAGSLGLLIGGAAGALPEPAARLIRIAQSNSQRLVRLINDILDIEKIESGQVAFRFKRLSATSLVEQVIEANRAYADGFHVRVRLNDETTNAEVYADPDRLAQVMTNLLSNAVKFSPRDGEVVVSVAEAGNTVRFAVRDRGPGIPQQFRPRIFEKFAQADATDARKKGGTGLGLSIVKQIVARLGGAVGFEDAEGGGTIFWIALPTWAEVSANEIDPERGGRDIARILLCEDNLDTAFALRYGLRPLGFSTDFAHSPADALTRVCAARYDALLVDLDLPDGDGLSLVRTLRAQPEIYKTPIVVLSSDDRQEKNGTDSATDLNILEWMQKPADAERLAQILDPTIVRDANGRARILHVDDDHDVLEIVAQTFDTTANIVSVDSIEKARFALALHDFDLAILDISVGEASGLDLLPNLRSRKGKPTPVVVFSAHAAELAGEAEIEANVNKSSTASLDNLVAAVRDRLMLRSAL